jgi:hypothetical protein
VPLPGIVVPRTAADPAGADSDPSMIDSLMTMLGLKGAPPVVPPFWSSTTQSAGAVDVTAAMLDPVQALIDGTVKQQWIGKGRDVAKKSGAVEVNEVVSFLMFWIFFDFGF